jgi:hypothetical protein
VAKQWDRHFVVLIKALYKDDLRRKETEVSGELATDAA